MGTVADPVTYWLGVSAIPFYQDVQETKFGWKTSIDHWNDDAVWLDDPQDTPPWRELRYPQSEPIESILWGESIDLAFVITPEPATLGLLLLGGTALLMNRRKKGSS